MPSFKFDRRTNPIVKHQKPFRSKVSAYERGIGSQSGSMPADRLPALYYKLGSFCDMQPSGPARTAANKALDKLYDDFNQKGDLLVAWKQRQDALDQAAGIMGTVVRTIRAVKRRDPRILRAILRKHPEAKDIASQPSSIWLGYWFGIVPTIGDLHHALGIFATDLPAGYFSHTGGTSQGIDWSGEPPFREGYRGQATFLCKIGGRVSAVDPNVHLATMLGFGQPVSVALELIPFSWLLGYFVNVGQLATNLEPRFPGFTFASQYTTFFVKFDGYYAYVRDLSKGELVLAASSKMIHMRRHTTWPRYGLEFNSPANLSGQRLSYITAVAISLLSGMK